MDSPRVLLKGRAERSILSSLWDADVNLGWAVERERNGELEWGWLIWTVRLTQWVEQAAPQVQVQRCLWASVGELLSKWVLYV